MNTKYVKGATFYLSSYTSCVDIDIEPGVEELHIRDYMNIELMNIFKQFPDVKKIFIEHPSISAINIPNFMFPNVREIISSSKYFKSGPMLVKISGHRTFLLNTFCLHPDECVDMKNINYINDYAFAGCMTTNIINCNSIKHCDDKSFCGSVCQLRNTDGVVTAGSIIIDARNVSEISDEGCNFIMDSVAKKIDTINITNLDTLLNSNALPKNIIIHDTETLDRTSPEKLHDCFVKATLQNITVDEGSKSYKTVDGILYSQDGKTLIMCPKDNANPHINEGTETIYAMAFIECENLRDLNIPDSVTTLESKAFYNCQNLTSIHIGNGLRSIGSDSNTNIFMYCSDLKKVHIPSNIKYICNGAFYGCPLHDVVFEEGVEEISDGAFGPGAYEAQLIKSVNLPKSLRYIGGSNFIDVPDIYLEGDRMPVGFIKNVTMSSKNRNDTKDEYFGIMTIHIKGHDIIIPRNPTDRSNLDSMFSNLDVDAIGESFINSLYTYTSSVIDMQDTAIAIYEKTHDENVKVYLKESARKIVNRLLRQENEDMLTRFLRLGFISKRSLQSLLSKVQEKNMLSVSAYIMNEINKNAPQGKKSSPRFTL